MEPNEFVQKQLDVNRDVIKVMKITEKQTQIQNELNRKFAETIDGQATRIKTLEQIVYVVTFTTIAEIIALAILIATK